MKEGLTDVISIHYYSVGFTDLKLRNIILLAVCIMTTIVQYCESQL